MSRIKELMSMLNIESKEPQLDTTSKDFIFMDIPEKVRAGRGLSKEMKNAQATLKLHPGQSARIKVCSSRSAASSAVQSMRKSPHWEGFELVARDKAVFATYTKEQ